MRAIDVVGAAVGLVLTLPLSIVIGVAIKATSSGPVVFRQSRVGHGGQLFEVLKFRTMADGTHAEVLNDPLARRRYEANDFKLPADDPRITRVGRFLRKTSLDEVPQLVNVLRGDMSLVGVRPLLERELERRSALDQALYRAHLPGVTGLWQIGGRSTVGDHDRIRLDHEYLQSWSVRSNLAILLRTPLAVLRGAGAH
jgi:lipopolysaccharide/colanic/teichoic acid biosynthesis glycosyltransferase